MTQKDKPTMDIDSLSTESMDYDSMEIISEMEIPFDVDPNEIRKELMVAAKYFGGLSAVQQRKDTLAEQRDRVLQWFAEQEEKITKSEDFLRGVIEKALYAAEISGEKKPKIKTWAGTAYFTERSKADWKGHKNTDNEIIAFAKKHKLPVEVIEKTNLTDVKKKINELPEEERPDFYQETKTKSLTIKLEKDVN